MEPLELWVYDAEGLQVLNVLWGTPTPEQRSLNRMRSRVPVERDGKVVMVETSFSSIWWWFGTGTLFFEDEKPILPHLRLPPGSFRIKVKPSHYEPLEQWIRVAEEDAPIVPLELTLHPLDE